MTAKPNLHLVGSAPEPRNVPLQRGFAPVYRIGERNICPGCGRSQFYVGRTLAECAFTRCGAAIPIGGER